MAIRRIHRLGALVVALGLLATACAAEDEPETEDATGGEAEDDAEDDAGDEAEDNADDNADEAQNGERPVIRIGAPLSETGNFAPDAEAVRHGREIWAEWVDERGGIDVGGEMHDIEFIYYDDESDPQTSMRLTERLITEDEVDFIFGPYSSSLFQAVSAISEANQVIMLSDGAASPAIFNRGLEYVFTVNTVANHYTTSGIELLAGEGVETMAILHIDDPFSNAITDGAVAAAEEHGIEVVAVDAVPPDVTDISGPMTRIARLDPDLFVGPGHLALGILYVQTMQDLDWTPSYALIGTAPSEASFVEELGAGVVEGIMGPAQWDRNVQWEAQGQLAEFGSAQDFAATYEEKHGVAPGYLPPPGAAIGLMLQAAIEEAGTIETEAVREALYDLDMQTFFGPINVAGPEDDNPAELMGAPLDRPMVTVQLRDGETEIVAPPDAATAEVVELVPWSER